jgi:glycerol-3-phosphate dehydrogenase (NAD(P)+)
MRAAVIGAGSWGTAVALLLAANRHEVRLWARDPALAADINATRRNPRYVSSAALPDGITATSDLSAALEGADAAVLATPSSAALQTAERMSAALGAQTPLLVLSKGLEHSTGELLLEALAARLGCMGRMAQLSGPNHAEEVALGILSATLVASTDEQVASFFQAMLTSPRFRVYRSDDVIGVQLCGAAKNIIAIAAGVAVGLGFGDNTAAMIMTRGLAEISRLVSAAGGNPTTCMGLAGMGDLVVTCASKHSRNRRFGCALVEGASLEGFESETHMVVEGARAAMSIPKLAATLGVEMPISDLVRAVVWEGAPIADAISMLMERPYKPEFY